MRAAIENFAQLPVAATAGSANAVSNGSATGAGAAAGAGAGFDQKVLILGAMAELVREGKVRAMDGTEVAIQADTICLHGDGAHPVEFAQRLRHELMTAGITVKALGT